MAQLFANATIYSPAQPNGVSFAAFVPPAAPAAPTCSICTGKGHYDLDCPDKPKTANALLQHFVSHPFMADMPEGDMLRLSKILKDAFTEMAKPGRKLVSRQEYTPDICLIVDDTHYQINKYEIVNYNVGKADYIIEGFRCNGCPLSAPRIPIAFDKNMGLGDYLRKILLCHNQPNRIIISYRHIAPVIVTYSEMLKKWAERDELEITLRNEFVKLENSFCDDEEHDDACWRGDYTYERFMRHIVTALTPH
jgi:hypothetical protein